MELILCPWTSDHTEEAAAIFNSVVAGGQALLREEALDREAAAPYFGTRAWTELACEAESGRVIGVCMLTPAAEGRSRHIGEVTWAVSADRQGTRADQALLMDAMGRARKHGFSVLTARIPACNIPAAKLLKNAGFEKNGRVPKGFRLPDGRFAELEIYTLSL